jgi:hypothetical protein
MGRLSLEAAKNKRADFALLVEPCQDVCGCGRGGGVADGVPSLREVFFADGHKTLYHGRQYVLIYVYII